MTVKVIKSIMVLFVLTYIVLLFVKPGLPEQSQIQRTIVENVPLQSKITISPISQDYKNFTYEISPLYSYEIEGLVVSGYSSKNWMDFTHKSDPANTKDICVVWGENISSNAYQKVKYKSGEFTCYYSYNKAFDPPFDGQHLSNNHLIPKNADIEKLIDSVNIGDQIRIRGYLSNYTVADEKGNPIFSRNTSTTRADTRNGACEIIYVDEIEILQRGNVLFYAAKKYLPILILTLAAFLLFVPSLFKQRTH